MLRSLVAGGQRVAFLCVSGSIALLPDIFSLIERYTLLGLILASVGMLVLFGTPQGRQLGEEKRNDIISVLMIVALVSVGTFLLRTSKGISVTAALFPEQAMSLAQRFGTEDNLNEMMSILSEQMASISDQNARILAEVGFVSDTIREEALREEQEFSELQERIDIIVSTPSVDWGMPFSYISLLSTLATHVSEDIKDPYYWEAASSTDIIFDIKQSFAISAFYPRNLEYEISLHSFDGEELFVGSGLALTIDDFRRQGEFYLGYFRPFEPQVFQTSADRFDTDGWFTCISVIDSDGDDSWTEVVAYKFEVWGYADVSREFGGRVYNRLPNFVQVTELDKRLLGIDFEARCAN